MGRRLYRQRCAAAAVRVGTACVLLSVCGLRTAQDCSRVDLRFWPRSWRLRIFRARTAHENVRLVAVGRRTKERGLVVRAMCTPVV